jgi:hypothetical protein
VFFRCNGLVVFDHVPAIIALRKDLATVAYPENIPTITVWRMLVCGLRNFG